MPPQALVVFDEAYKEYVEDSEYPQTERLLERYPQLILLRTFSKIYGLAGLRVGYALCNSQLVRFLEKTGPPFAVNRMAQIMALAALKDNEHFHQSQRLIWEQKEYLYQKLHDLQLTYVPTEANFILIQTDYPAQEVFASLLRRGVIVRSAEMFGYPDAIRLTIGTFKENQIFLEAIQETLKELEGKKA